MQECTLNSSFSLGSGHCTANFPSAGTDSQLLCSSKSLCFMIHLNSSRFKFVGISEFSGSPRSLSEDFQFHIKDRIEFQRDMTHILYKCDLHTSWHTVKLHASLTEKLTFLPFLHKPGGIIGITKL